RTTAPPITLIGRAYRAPVLLTRLAARSAHFHQSMPPTATATAMAVPTRVGRWLRDLWLRDLSDMACLLQGSFRHRGSVSPTDRDRLPGPCKARASSGSGPDRLGPQELFTDLSETGDDLRIGAHHPQSHGTFHAESADYGGQVRHVR